MLKSIKWKIFFGFLVLAFMLFVAGSITIYEFVGLTRTVNALLEHNYKTMQSAITMLESLEREDSGILLVLSGNDTSGVRMIHEGDSSFMIAYHDAIQYSQGPENERLVGEIRENYDQYRLSISLSDIGKISTTRVSWYSGQVYPVFVDLKSAIKALMIHNQDIIFSETNRLRDKSQRATMPGIIAIISALALTVIFTYFINKFFVRPLIKLTGIVENYKSTNDLIDADIQTQDELKRLETAIQDLIYRLRRR
jgi:methyl-accepting chemotaxis protein